jgi:protein SCO1/2
MRRVAVVLTVLSLLAGACGNDESKAKPLSVPGEKIYTLDGTIISRDADDNTLRIDHKAIPGYMEAMTMDYTVRGADVKSLPPDHSHIQAKLHIAGDAYWVTDVRKPGP